MHLCFVMSSQTPYVVSDDRAITADMKSQSNKILIKLFKQSLAVGEDPTLASGNSGSNGIATIIVGNSDVIVLRNTSINNFEEEYPSVEQIANIANQYLLPALSTSKMLEEIDVKEFISSLENFNVYF